MDIFLATRFYETDAEKSPLRLAQLSKLIDSALAIGVEGVGIAVRTDVDRSGAIEFVASKYDERVIAFPVTPWGKFVPALAALLQRACEGGFQKLLCASVEIQLTEAVIKALNAEVDEANLVAGLSLEGHAFEPGEHDCDGLHSPWNTAALWRIRNGLDRIGFASTGEALFDPHGSNSGVEEVSTIALYQQLYSDCSAVLVHMEGVSWEAGLSSKPNAVSQKLKSKNTRPAAQLAHAALLPGRVTHKLATPY